MRFVFVFVFDLNKIHEMVHALPPLFIHHFSFVVQLHQPIQDWQRNPAHDLRPELLRQLLEGLFQRLLSELLLFLQLDLLLEEVLQVILLLFEDAVQSHEAGLLLRVSPHFAFLQLDDFLEFLLTFVVELSVVFEKQRIRSVKQIADRAAHNVQSVDGEPRPALHDLLGVLCYFPLVPHLLEAHGFREAHDDFLAFAEAQSVDFLELVDALEEELHVDLGDGLLPGLVEVLAVFPVELLAADGLRPVVEAVLYVLEDAHMVFVDFLLLLEFGCEGVLGDGEFVAVLVERHHKETEEGYDDSEQSADIRQSIIDLPIFPLNL